MLPFAVLELIAVAVAFLAYARHATDGDRISLLEGRLVVEQETAGQTKRCEFAREWVRVEPQDDDDQMIEVRGWRPVGAGGAVFALRSAAGGGAGNTPGFAWRVMVGFWVGEPGNLF